MKSVGVLEVGSGGIGTVKMAVRLALAVTLSYELASLLPRNDLLLMAPFTTLFVIHGSPFATVGESIQRMLGTCVGVVLATLYVGVVSIEALTFCVGILAALLAARALPFGPIGQMQIASGALFVLVLGDPVSGSGYWRILDVIIGGIVGIAAAFIMPPPPRLGSAEQAIGDLLDGQAAQLRRVAAEIGTHEAPLPEPRRHDFDASSVALGELEAAAESELEAAAESLRFRARARRNAEQLRWLAKETRWVVGLNAQIRSISGAVDRLYDREGDEPALVARSGAAAARILCRPTRIVGHHPNPTLRPRHTRAGPGRVDAGADRGRRRPRRSGAEERLAPRPDRAPDRVDRALAGRRPHYRIAGWRPGTRVSRAGGTLTMSARNTTNHVSTGQLPPRERVRELVDEAHDRFVSVTEGRNADYIPALASVPSTLFGICIAGVSGEVYSAGDTEVEFSIQSVSKPFVFALVCNALGADAVRTRLGVNATGLPFNSVMAIELHEARTINPLVNAGAIATTSLAPGATSEAKWRFIHDGLSLFAGRDLTFDADIYASEAGCNQRNQGIARLLESYDRIDFDPLEATDVYTRQCAVKVTARDLAVMGATLADGGVNPGHEGAGRGCDHLPAYARRDGDSGPLRELG